MKTYSEEEFVEACLQVLEKVKQGLAGVSISHFTDEELQVIRMALEFHL